MPAPAPKRRRISGRRIALGAVVLAMALAAAPRARADAGDDPGLHPLRDAGRALRTVGADTWFIVSSPSRMDRGDALQVAAVAGITAVLYNNDEAITRAAGRNAEAPVYAPLKRVGYNLESTGLMGRMIPYYTGAMVLGYVTRNRPLTVIPAEIIECHLVGGMIRNVLKVPIGRRRPFEMQGSRSFEFDGGTSFPSGHTSVVFEAATVVSMHARRWPVTVVAYGLAATIAIQRVDSHNHWASDVFVPAVTGTFLSRAIVERHRPSEQTHASSVRVGAVPAPGGGAGLGVAIEF